MNYSSLLTAILVLLGIYLIFFLIRLLADMVIVGIALTAAAFSYNIEKFYPHIRPILEDSSLVNLFNITLPQGNPDGGTIFFIAVVILVSAVLLCLPFLPFSATYRQMLGVEKPSEFQEAKLKKWITQEVERVQQQQLEEP